MLIGSGNVLQQSASELVLFGFFFFSYLSKKVEDRENKWVSLKAQKSMGKKSMEKLSEKYQTIFKQFLTNKRNLLKF